MKSLNIKSSMKSASFKKGSYSALLSAIVIAVVIVVNLLASQLPNSVKSIDMSNQKYYTVGSQTKKIVKKLSNDITIYQMTKTGSEDSKISKLLETYKSLSDKVKVETLDPDRQPGLVTKYSASEASENSLIVVCGDRFKLIDYNDIVEQDYSDYYSSGKTSQAFDGEGEITSAINYVTTSDLPKMYTLAGHSEQAIGATVSAAIKEQNITSADLNLLTATKIPDDCNILAIVCPGSDCSADEAKAIISYLEAGGKALIMMSYTGTDMPNFSSVLEAYGVQMQKGYVVENNKDYYYQNGYYLIPDVEDHDITQSFANKMYIMSPMAQGIVTLPDTRSTLKIEKLLTSTDDSYSDIDYGQGAAQDGTNQKASDDVDGPFTLAAAISEQNSDKSETQLVVFGSYTMFTDNVVGSFSLGNVEMLTNSLTWMSNNSTGTINIDAKSMDVATNTISTGTSNLWTAVTVVLVPLVVIVTGFVVWFRRRKA